MTSRTTKITSEKKARINSAINVLDLKRKNTTDFEKNKGDLN